ncbi:MAG: diacylglycerol kinase family lipid kinase [Armatimonadetes bacterium]|nr:diacylglycerol kinase family lipid kinase [Armatimonadota bacterium]
MATEPDRAAMTQSEPLPDRAALIMNPTSGRGAGASMVRRLPEALAAAMPGTAWTVRTTERSGHARELAARAARDGAQLLVAAGGDGTVGDVAAEAAAAGVDLGVIPAGTGNDLARHYGIRLDMDGAVAALARSRVVEMDMGMANDRPFVNISGCGFDAVVASRTNRGFRFLKGHAAYTAATFLELMRFRPAAFVLRVDGVEHRGRAMLCTVANTSSYGGGMLIAPEADASDGMLDACVLWQVTKVEFARAFPLVFKGEHVHHPRVTMLRGSVIEVDSDPPMPILIDGEVAGRTPVRFSVRPNALRLRAPTGFTGRRP